MAVLAIATAVQAANITWHGAESDFWWEPGNWYGDATFYTDGDDVTINGPATVALNWKEATGIPPSDPPVKPRTVLFDASAGDVEILWGWGPWGASAFGYSETVTKVGAGTLFYTRCGGWWSGAVTTVYNINAGVWRMDHIDDHGHLGDGSTVNLNGGQFFYNDWNPFTGETDFNVTADSNLMLGSDYAAGWAESVVDIDISAGVTLNVLPDPGYATAFTLNNELLIDVAGDTAGMVDVVDMNLVLLDDSALTLNCTGSQTGPIVLVDYTGGSLTGIFGTETGVPAGLSIDYAYAGGTQIALVPEPATMALLAFGGLGVLLRRRRR